MSTPNKLCDNLNFLMTEMRISADELARRTEIPASTIKKIRNHYNPNPTLTTLMPLAKFFAITLGELAGDEPFPIDRIRGLHQPNPKISFRVPILSWGDTISWINHHHTLSSEPSISTEIQLSPEAFALIVEEDDWENLAKGTALIIDPKLTPIHRDFIIVYKDGQEIPSLKQALFDEDQLYLKPIISGYNITAFTNDHKIIGVVVEYKKSLRKIT